VPWSRDTDGDSPVRLGVEREHLGGGDRIRVPDINGEKDGLMKRLVVAHLLAKRARSSVLLGMTIACFLLAVAVVALQQATAEGAPLAAQAAERLRSVSAQAASEGDDPGAFPDVPSSPR
jgi:hypothetical protein